MEEVCAYLEWFQGKSSACGQAVLETNYETERSLEGNSTPKIGHFDESERHCKWNWSPICKKKAKNQNRLPGRGRFRAGFTYRIWVAPCHSHIACHNSTLLQSGTFPYTRKREKGRFSCNESIPLNFFISYFHKNVSLSYVAFWGPSKWCAWDKGLSIS